MLLDNLFPALGEIGTAAMLLVIIAIVGSPALGAVVLPALGIRRLPSRGR
jgi:hypothetical protein